MKESSKQNNQIFQNEFVSATLIIHKSQIFFPFFYNYCLPLPIYALASVFSSAKCVWVYGCLLCSIHCFSKSFFVCPKSPKLLKKNIFCCECILSENCLMFICQSVFGLCTNERKNQRKKVWPRVSMCYCLCCRRVSVLSVSVQTPSHVIRDSFDFCCCCLI